MGEARAMVPAHVDAALPGMMRFDVAPPLRGVPFADKLLAAAAFERTGGAFLWLDVDSFFFRRPVFSTDFAILVNPVDKRNIGDLFGGPRGPVWRLLRAHFGLEDDAGPVFASASGEAIYPYFNVGMVVVRENRGLFSTAARKMRELLVRADVRALLDASAANRIFFHQAVFNCALLSLYGAGEIGALPYGVNYPMHLHAAHVAPVPPEEWVTVRYDTYFHDRAAPEPWRDRFAGKEGALRMAWYYDE